MATQHQIRRELLRFCHLLYERSYLCSVDGNLSVRVGENFLTTPSGRNKGLIELEDLVLVDSTGNSLESGKKPSSEFKMHRKVYELRPDVEAVVHCHPVYATAFAASHLELSDCLLTESIVAMGTIPKAPLAIPSTDEIPESIVPYVPNTNALLLANHGVLTYGESLEDAYNKMESVEHFAKITYITKVMQSQAPVPAHAVERLEGLRDRYGLTAPFIPCTRADRSEESSNEESVVENSSYQEQKSRSSLTVDEEKEMLADVIAAVLKKRVR